MMAQLIDDLLVALEDHLPAAAHRKVEMDDLVRGAYQELIGGAGRAGGRVRDRRRCPRRRAIRRCCGRCG